MSPRFISPKVASELAYLAGVERWIDDYALFEAGKSPRGIPLWEFQFFNEGAPVHSCVLELDTNMLPGFESLLAKEILFPTLMERHRRQRGEGVETEGLRTANDWALHC